MSARAWSMFTIGDGRHNYSPENILEMYYSVAMNKCIFITGDLQEGLNPAYNRDRGPVSIFSLRVHSGASHRSRPCLLRVGRTVGRTNGTSLSHLKPDSEEIGKAGRHPSCPSSCFPS
jgi:hypothetical protein